MAPSSFYHLGLGHDAKWINGRTHAIFGLLKPLAALAAQGVEQLRLASAGFAHEYQGFRVYQGRLGLTFRLQDRILEGDCFDPCTRLKVHTFEG